MPEEKPKTTPGDIQAEEKVMHWRFWFLVILSALLFVTFVLYLPLRFRYQSSLHEPDKTMQQEVEPHGHAPGEEELPHGH